jgi:hypothetical protein
MKMILTVLLARIIAVLSGASLLVVLLWLIWEKFSLAIISGSILSMFSFVFSVIIGSLVGEHFLRFLKKRKMN